jgi:hypothetical protein
MTPEQKSAQAKRVHADPANKRKHRVGTTAAMESPDRAISDAELAHRERQRRAWRQKRKQDILAGKWP